MLTSDKISPIISKQKGNLRENAWRRNVTVCIAAICENQKKMVLASDSMLTNPSLSIEFEQPTRKMTVLSENCIALTAGSALAYTELFNIVQHKISGMSEPSVNGIVELMKTSYQEIREREINERILRPRGINDLKDFLGNQQKLLPEITMRIQHEIDSYDYSLDIILAGFSGEEAHIYGITDPGTSICFDAVGFHAIGSGLPHAVNALIARECYPTNKCEDTLIIVYEAKKMAEKAPGVGGRFTNICLMEPKKYKFFTDDEIGELKNIYRDWCNKEKGVFDRVSSLIQGERKNEKE